MTAQSQANTAAAGPRSGFGIWLDQHLYSFVASLGRVLRRPWTTLLTIGVMAVALALPLGLGLALDNLRHFAGSVALLRALPVTVCAEGVDDAEDAAALWECGVEAITGPWASARMP